MENRYRNMKLTLILSAMLTLPALSSAQGSVQYTYDNAGNRTSQSRVYEENRHSSPFGQADRIGDGVAIGGLVGGHIVRAAMQSGLLHVEVLGLRQGDRCLLAVYSLGGQVLLSQEATDTRTSLDLSGYSSGVYLLQVRINDDRGTWKLTKN